MMNIKNYEFLKDQVFYSGFGDVMEDDLKQHMLSEDTTFKLNFRTGNEQQELHAVLNFSKSKQSDMFFFNSYTLEILEKDSGDKISSLFYVNGTDRFTLKEAYNLLHGRSVNKNLTTKRGETYNAWVKLEFTEFDSRGNFKMRKFHENYGFDLPAELKKYPIQELLYNDSKAMLLESLGRGNRQSVTFQVGEGKIRMMVEAAPEFKTVHVYDQQNLKVELDDIPSMSESTLNTLESEDDHASRESAAGENELEEQQQHDNLEQQEDVSKNNEEPVVQKKRRRRTNA